MQTPPVHAVANELPHSATWPDGHFLQVWSWIAEVSWSASVLMKNDRPRFASAQPKPPVSATSSDARFERLTAPTLTLVVPLAPSCTKLIGASIWMSFVLPAVVSIFTPQS